MSRNSNGHINGNGKPFANPHALLQGLRHQDRTVELFDANPALIARAWSTAQMCDDTDRAACIDLIETALVKLDLEVIRQFAIKELFRDAHKVWPNCFYEQASLASMWAIAKASDRCENGVTKFLEICRRLFQENSRWAETLEMINDPMNANLLCDVMSSMMGICVSMGHIPIPSAKKGQLDISIGKLKFFIKRDGAGKATLPIVCWIGKTEMTVINWKVSDRETREMALAFTVSLIRDLRPDPRYMEILDKTREQQRQILDRIEILWCDIRRVAEGDSTTGFRRWIMGGGLTHLLVEFQNNGFSKMVGPITLTPGLFPEVQVMIPWRLCNSIGMDVVECDKIDPYSGLLQDLHTTFIPDSDEWYLHLRLCLAIVETLHKLAFAPSFCNEQTRERNNGNGHSSRAVLPHFRRLGIRCRNGEQVRDNASGEAVARSVDMVGMEPPDGYTFAATPPIVCERHNPALKPIVLEATISI
jgi:hypothetical protein